MSDKVTVQTVDSLQNQTSALNKINSNFTVLADKIDTLLSRDGDTPNQMESVLDMNSNRIINLPVPENTTEPVRLAEIQTLVSGGIPEGSIDGDRITVGTLPENRIEGKVSNSKLTDMAQATVKGRASGSGTGPPVDLTGAQLAAIIGSGSVDGANITNGTVVNDKLANMPAATIKGRASGAGTGVPVDLTDAELRTIIGNVASGTAGLAPASGGGTTNFLRADGTWTSPPSGGSITLAAAQATTSGTQFDFTGLPAGINELVVHFNGVSLSGTDFLLVQLGTSSGVETASYVSMGNAVNTVGLASFPATNFPATSVAGLVIPTIGIVWAFNGQMFIRRMSGNTWNASLGGSGAAPGDFSVYYGGGIKTLAGTLDRIRITRTGSSTFDAGAVSISYT
jgi:hypothetical protein